MSRGSPEEVTNGGTGRFVDSSVSRVRVWITGLADGRYMVASAGRQGARGRAR
ncbi:MAG: transglutaminase family protein [Gammaproteobacteria bacterium]